MKVIFRADDMGITDAYNVGGLKAIDQGVVSTVEVMLDMPGTEHALSEMKNRPWVTVNWHPRFWLKPAERDREALLSRLRKEVEQCILIYGQAPFAATLSDCGEVADVVRQVCGEYGILTDYYNAYGLHDYEGLGRTGLTFDDYRAYDPISELENMPEDECISVCTFYPGFLDAVSLRMTLKDGSSERNVHRIQDVSILCSGRLKDLIGRRRFEIVSLRDVVWGKHDYQNKLVCDRSSLAMR